jgi:hypothetical protein
MTLFEWKITDCGNGEYGYIWIANSGKDEFGAIHRVYVDPDNDDAWLSKSTVGIDGNQVGNVVDSIEAHEEPCCEWQYPASWYGRILLLWKRLGSPRIDRMSPGYEAPWFPWLEAGFTNEERDNLIAKTSNVETVEAE